MKKKLSMFLGLMLSLVLGVMLIAACGNKEHTEHYDEDGDGYCDDCGEYIFDDDYSYGGGDYSNPWDDYNLIDWGADYDLGYYDIYVDASEAGTFNPQRGIHLYEAEFANLNANVSDGYWDDWNQVWVDEYSPRVEWNDSASRGQNVGYIDSGSTITFNINSTADCTVLVVLSMSTADENYDGFDADSTLMITNGDYFVDTSDCWIYGTGSWAYYEENIIGELELYEGENSIDVMSFGGFNLDYMVLVPKYDVARPSVNYDGAELWVDAFDCYLEGCRLEVSGDNGEYTNLGWTSYNTVLEFIVNSSSEADVELFINAAVLVNESLPIDGRIQVYVNGQTVEIPDFSSQTSNDDGNWWMQYQRISLGNIHLTSGENTVSVNISNNFNLDGFWLV